MTILNLKTKEEFEGSVKGLAAVHFWASWCDPCKQMDAIFAQLAAENPQTNFIRVEAEEAVDISEAYDVSAVPFFLFFKNGAVIDRLEGANPPELAHKVARHVASPGYATSAPGSVATISGAGASAAPSVIESVLSAARKSSADEGKSKSSQEGNGLSPEVKSKIERIIAEKPVVLFMKGDPDSPRCGFSLKVVNVLKELKVDFGSFDILGDEDVRSGVKIFSKWPTFPQLYCRGELVGGCDIVLEMHQNGELKEFFEEKGVMAEAPKSIEERVKGLVNSAQTILFMKGSPEEPRCGFSRKVVAALQKEGVKFSTFDILEDEEVRQGLKEFSRWPTYPQLYHRGELIGGCDIVLEMQENGELGSTLAA